MNGGRRPAPTVSALVAALVVCAVVASCGGGDDAGPASPSTAPPVIDVDMPDPTEPPASTAHAAATTTATTAAPAGTVPSLPERVVALSEEILLADLLAVGVVPVASTSNRPDGFPGIDPALTDGIQPIFSPDLNLEALAALRPDVLVIQQQYLDLGIVDLGTLEAIAPVQVIDGDDWRTTLLAVGAAFGRETLAEEVAVQVDDAFADAASVLRGRELSVMSIVPGPLVRAYAAGGIDLVDHLLDVGVALRPGADTDGIDATGRIVLSDERLDLLDAPTLLMLQSDQIEGEAAARAEVEASALWSALPAVAAGDVVVLDRLGYPGALGAGAFLADLVIALA